MATCQHKDGCDKEATDRVVATYNGRQHVRLLCDQHTRSAVHGSGLEHVRAVVEGQYGRFRRASTHVVYRESKRRGWQPHHISDTLHVGVAENSPLQPGDPVQVVFEDWHSRRGEDRSVRWGVATVERVGQRAQTAKYEPDRRYRVITVKWPYAWQQEIASIVQYPLNPTQDLVGNGNDDKKRWKAHFAAQRVEETAKRLAAYDAERATER